MTDGLALAGYSGRPLPEKLGLKLGMVVAFVALPEGLSALAETPGLAAVDRFPAWGAVRRKALYDVVHAFTASRAELEADLRRLQDAIRRDGMIWVSWPKKAAKVETDVTEDVVRNAALALDLVDVKVAAVDAVWSGLKLVIRKDRR